MWFYVLTIAVKCYFEMQIKLWLRDFHENGVVYKVAVWKQVQRETFCGPIWGFVTKRLVRGRCRTRSWGPSVMKDLANGLRLVFSLQIIPPVKVKFQFKTPNSFPATLKMMRPACWKWDFFVHLRADFKERLWESKWNYRIECLLNALYALKGRVYTWKVMAFCS